MEIEPLDEVNASGSDGAAGGLKAIEIVQSALSWAYDAALNGMPGLGTLEDFVSNYVSDGRSPEDAIESLISWQMAKAGTAGFITGLGGIITLPAAIPANLASVLFIQLR